MGNDQDEESLSEKLKATKSAALLLKKTQTKVAAPPDSQVSPQTKLKAAADSTGVAISLLKRKQTKNKKAKGVLKVIKHLTTFRDTGPVYKKGELEAAIYNLEADDHLGHGDLLNYDELIPEDCDDNGAVQDPPPRLLRFFIDTRVFVIDLVFLATVVCSCFTFPLTFIWYGSWSEPNKVPCGRLMMILDMISDLFYGVHLLLRLNISFIHPTRRVEVTSRKLIIQRWLRDPLYWIMCLSTTTYIFILAGVPCIINNIKVVRAYHLITFPDSLWRLEESSKLRILRPIVLLVGASHYVGCLLACVGGYRERLREALEAGTEDKLSTNFLGHTVSPEWSLYFMAFVEGLYMLTGALDNPLGDGSHRNKDFGSLLIVAIFGPVGCVVVALFIAAIVREQSLKYSLDMRNEESKAAMSRALHILNIPCSLQRRVFSLHYYQKMGHDHEAFAELFSKKNLSAPLEAALLVWLYRHILQYSPYFKVQEDVNYVIEVVRVLETEVFVPGDYVARRGEVAEVMYFIASGVLSVHVPDLSATANGIGEKKTNFFKQTIKVCELKRGDKFGEVALIKDCVRTAWVLAVGYAILSALARHKIEPIWKHFPREKEDLVKKVKETAEKDRKRVLNQKFKKMVKAGLGKTMEMKALNSKGEDTSDQEVTNQQSDVSDGGPITTVDTSRVESVNTNSSAGGITPQASVSSKPRRSSREEALYQAEHASQASTSDRSNQIISGDSVGIDVRDCGHTGHASHNHESNVTDLLLEGFSQLSTRMDTLMHQQASLERMVMSLSCRGNGDAAVSAGRSASSCRSIPIEGGAAAGPLPVQLPPYVPVLPPPTTDDYVTHEKSVASEKSVAAENSVASERTPMDRGCKKKHKKQGCLKAAGTSTDHDGARKSHRARQSRCNAANQSTPDTSRSPVSQLVCSVDCGHDPSRSEHVIHSKE